jgi:hypothetical protein
MNSPFSPQALAWLYEEESSFSIHYFSNARQDTIMNPHTSNNAMGSDKKIGKPTAMKCSEPSEATLDKDQYRRMRNAYNWYKLLAQPTRATMCRILDYTKGADFTRQGVDLLPWIIEESKVSEEAMKSLKKEKKEVSGKPGKSSLLDGGEDTVKTLDFAAKSNGYHTRQALLKEELGDSLTSLETSLNSSSGYLDASFSNWDQDGAMYVSDKGESDSSVISADMSSKRAVSFGLIQIREYNRVVGDNPTVSFGPPLSIGWEFVQNEALHIDVYESKKLQRTSPLLMNSITRKSMLRNIYDVPAEDIRAAEQQVQKVQRQRLQTLNQGKAGRVVENAMYLAKRRFLRRFSRDPLLECYAKQAEVLIPMSV